MKRKPNPRPSAEATRVAQPRSPRAYQRAAWSTRPPSSGQRRKQVEREQDEVCVAEPGGDPVECIREASAGQPDEEHTEHE